MVHLENFVVSIKCNGKFLREHSRTVYLPFNSHFSIYLKNKNSRDAVADIYIDGECVSSSGIIVRSNSSAEVERWVEKARKFLFIEKTEAVEQYHGNDPEQGLVEVRWRYTKRRPKITYIEAPIEWDDFWTSPQPQYTTRSFMSSVSSDNSSFVLRRKGISDAGITVEGDHSSQYFTQSHVGDLEDEEHVIVIELRGDTGTQLVKKPVSTSKKIKCPGCGKMNPSSHKFCSRCGTKIFR